MFAIIVLNTFLLTISVGFLFIINRNTAPGEKPLQTSGQVGANLPAVAFPIDTEYKDDFQTAAWVGLKPKGQHLIPGASQNATTYSVDVSYQISLNGNNAYVNKPLRAKLIVTDATNTKTYIFPNYIDVTFDTANQNKAFAFGQSYLPFDGANKFRCALQTPGIDGVFDNGDDDFATCTGDSLVTMFYTAGSRLFRFYSEGYKSHFYTATESERNYLIANNPNWKYENVAYRVVSINIAEGNCNDANATRIYRFWNEGTKKHFYTISEAERDNVIANDPNWKFEDRKFCGFRTQFSPEFAKPVFRFYSSVYGGHFYTASELEKQNLILNDPNWKYEGIAYYYRNIFNREEDQNP